MKIMIIGGGLVSLNLVSLILENPIFRDEIVLVEKDLKSCEKIANLFDIEVFHGDGSNYNVLKAAGAEEAEVFLALTGRDEDNLIASQLAKLYFHIKNPICRVNNPNNITVIRKLGILNTFSSSKHLAKVLTQEINHAGLYLVYDLPGNDMALVEFVLREGVPEDGMKIADCSFPGDSRVVLVTRNDRDHSVEPARGDTVMRAHDRIMMICQYSDFSQIKKRFVDADELHIDGERFEYDGAKEV